MKKPLTGNAADPQQVKEAAQKVKYGREQELNDVRAILATREGRRFFWRMLEHCKVFESVWHPSALIHHNSGKQDVGHFVLSEVMEANSEFFLMMINENKQEERDGVKA